MPLQVGLKIAEANKKRRLNKSINFKNKNV
jgi:hypothetical protein